MSFMNPANYTQFMQLGFYLEFAKPENWMAWMNLDGVDESRFLPDHASYQIIASYQIMMDPQTMAHWMNPGSYMHVLDPAMYQESINPANYMVYLNPATYAGMMGSNTCDQNNPNKTPGWFGYTC